MSRWPWLGLVLSVAACASSAAPPAATATTGVAREEVPAFSRPSFMVKPGKGKASGGASPARGADPETLADARFLENARHALELYREFIRRAGTDEGYAEAVSEARERIAELEQTIEFVEAGIRERAAR